MAQSDTSVPRTLRGRCDELSRGGLLGSAPLERCRWFSDLSVLRMPDSQARGRPPPGAHFAVFMPHGLLESHQQHQLESVEMKADIETPADEAAEAGLQGQGNGTKAAVIVST